MRPLIIAAFVAVAGASSALGQAAAAPQAFRGRLVGVFDEQSGDPVQGVEVRNASTGVFGLTTATGTLTLFYVDTAGGMLSIRKVGYEPQMLVVSNSPSDSSGITIVLKRSAQTLPAVVTKATNRDSVAHYISPGLKGFEERRHQGFGNFISEADLRKAEGWRLAELVLQHFPGAHLKAGAGATRILVGRSGCPVTVYMDGALYYKGGTRGSPPPDFGSMLADEYSGIEYYASSATLPIQFGADRSTACGTLLLWTRER